MILAVIGHGFAYEMECTARLFFPGDKINIVKEYGFTDTEDAIITQVHAPEAGKLRLCARVRLGGFDREAADEIPDAGDGLCERRLGLLLFGLLCEKTGKRPVWGMLTGIRPVRLCGAWHGQGLDDAGILTRFQEDYLVSREKAELCLEIEKAQRKFNALNMPDTFSLYIGIPFCPTRCLYCSFVSHAVDKAGKLVPEYVRALYREISVIAGIAGEAGMKLLTVYVGGGTPTALTAEQLGQILGAVKSGFNLSNLLEYTVEAGRPDTITPEKLNVMRSFGVDRISVNPQSMNARTLKAIGRAHSPEQAAESLSLARRAGFSAINMDLIAGLPGETLEDFAESLDEVLSLTPENVTVHTLAIKRSSKLRWQEGAFNRLDTDADAMHGLARERLKAAGYFPYYLYRQKAAAHNLENTGFSKPGHEGMYNIYSMGDAHHIFAAGAGGISKLICADGVIRRVFNYKYPYEYLSGFEEIIKRKGALKQCGR